MEDNEIKPCKNCKSTDYDNIDQEDFDYTEDGRIILEPTTCDICNPELTYTPPRDEMH